MALVTVSGRTVRRRQPPRAVGAGRPLSWDVLWAASAAPVNQASGQVVAPVAPVQPGIAGQWVDYQSTSAAQTFAIPSATTYTLVLVLAHPQSSTGSSGRIFANASTGVRVEAYTTGGGVYFMSTHTGVAGGIQFVTGVGGFDTRPWTYVLTYDGTTQRGWLRDPDGSITQASPATIGMATATQADIGFAGGASCGIYACGWRRGAVSQEQARDLVSNPWQMFAKRPRRVFVSVAGGGGSYSLTCAAGSYTGTGQAVGLLVSRSLAAAQGSYTLSGQNVALLRLYTLTAAQGAYSLSGPALALVVSRMLAAGQGNYTLTGQAVGLLASWVLAAGQGAYALTGQAAGLTYTPLGSYSLLADAGSYTITGQSVGLLASRLLAAAAGSYSLSGQDVGLTYTPAGASYTLTADVGGYALTGHDIAFARTYVLTAASGSYTLTGRAVTFSYSGAPTATVQDMLRTARGVARLAARGAARNTIRGYRP